MENVPVWLLVVLGLGAPALTTAANLLGVVTTNRSRDKQLTHDKEIRNEEWNREELRRQEEWRREESRRQEQKKAEELDAFGRLHVEMIMNREELANWILQSSPTEVAKIRAPILEISCFEEAKAQVSLLRWDLRSSILNAYARTRKFQHILYDEESNGRLPYFGPTLFVAQEAQSAYEVAIDHLTTLVEGRPPVFMANDDYPKT